MREVPLGTGWYAAVHVLDGVDTDKRIWVSRGLWKELSEKSQENKPTNQQNLKKLIKEIKVRLIQIYMFQVKVYKTL